MESKTRRLLQNTAKHFLAFTISKLQVLTAAVVLSPTFVGAADETKITHSFLALSAETYIVSHDAKIECTYPFSTRDGWALPASNLLLTLSNCYKYPAGAVAEFTRQRHVRF